VDIVDCLILSDFGSAKTSTIGSVCPMHCPPLNFPNSMKSALVELETLIEGDYIIEPYLIHANILISASIGRRKTGQINIINDSNQIVKLRGGQCIGQSEPIVEVLAEPKSDKIKQSTISNLLLILQIQHLLFHVHML
jgi:hypothetical protein